MKKYSFIVIMLAISLVLTYCGPSKKTTSSAVKEVPKSTYASSVSIVIMNNCVPCHVPAKGGNKKAYDNYANVKTDIDEMIRRIELNPGDKGFMPFKKAKLSDSTIAVFKQWKADGMLEK
jgi:hypothetical protein